MDLERRHSLKLLGTGLAAMAGGRAFGAPVAKTPPICFFTKMFQGLSFEELARLTAELGFDGVEATVRPGGHIEPEAVPDQLPEMVAALQKEGRALSIMASGINSASDPKQRAEQVLKTAAGLGVKRYRMGYLKYDFAKPIKRQLAEFKAQLKDLAAMNKELGIQALYQNHAGPAYVGAPIWDICELIEDLPREAISLAFDIRHVTVEAANCWQVNAARAMPLAGAVYVKDFDWDGAKVKNVPLGEGRVDAPKFVKAFDLATFDGPISLHVEYVNKKDPDLVAKGKAGYVADFATLKNLLKR